MRITQKPNKRTVTKAGEPLNPVMGNDVVPKDPSDMSQEEYEKGRRDGKIV